MLLFLWSLEVDVDLLGCVGTLLAFDELALKLICGNLLNSRIAVLGEVRIRDKAVYDVFRGKNVLVCHGLLGKIRKDVSGCPWPSSDKTALVEVVRWLPVLSKNLPDRRSLHPLPDRVQSHRLLLYRSEHRRVRRPTLAILPHP